jgi:hypothetical protein
MKSYDEASIQRLNIMSETNKQETNAMSDAEKLKLFTDRQDEEAKLHWSRNSYFLVVMSILFVAYGQKPVENAFQLTLFQVLISVLGATLSSIWLLIQHRSSKYILYYKSEAKKYAALTKTPDVYPDNLGGIEMRKLAYILPIAFLAIWIAFIILRAPFL